MSNSPGRSGMDLISYMLETSSSRSATGKPLLNNALSSCLTSPCVLEYQLTLSLSRHSKPNGYVEIQCLLPECQCDDDSTPPDNGLMDFSKKICDASEICGWSLREPNNYKKYLEEAGFKDVVEVRYKVPTSPWPRNKRMKLIGAFEMQSLLQGASAFSLRTFSKALGWSQQETEVFLMGMRRDCRDLRFHTYYEL